MDGPTLLNDIQKDDKILNKQNWKHMMVNILKPKWIL